MKVILLDQRAVMADCWSAYFSNEPDVSVVCDGLKQYLSQNKVDCIASPANSYGLMDGGFDLAISEYFGWDLQERVQNYIIRNFRGEQPVGTSFIIDTGKDGIKLIHTPTMRVPISVKDPMIVYQCTRTSLITALENNIESIVIPAFCGECGDVSPKVIGRLMYEAYKQIMNPPSTLDWNYANRWSPELQYYLESWRVKEEEAGCENENT